VNHTFRAVICSSLLFTESSGWYFILNLKVTEQTVSIKFELMETHTSTNKIHAKSK
jgi:hypothetical protein